MDRLRRALTTCLGPEGLLTGEAATQAGFSPWTKVGTPLAVARPSCVQEVSQVLSTARAAGVPVVPWGGLTGLVGGAAADGAVALSLSRMNAIEAIDRDQGLITVQAGCVLENACAAASAAGLFLPLDLGARGSATIGGVLSTNAGGNRVLRFGMARDMVLGLEVVLADGTVVSSLSGLIKNNTGYDLKQLFIGSEGTLGVITRAVLRLRPAPASQEVGLLAVGSFALLVRLLRQLEMSLSGTLSAFEVMWPRFYGLVTTPPAQGRAPLPSGHAYYVLVEALGGAPAQDRERFEQALAEAIAEGLAVDAVIAKSQAERDRMWALRDDVSQTARDGPIAAFDVSLGLGAMEDYVATVTAALEARRPSATLTVFGHLGDGNLHLIVGVDEATDRPELTALIYDHLRPFGGSISAEHGIGVDKRSYLNHSRTAQELSLMRQLKSTLDPTNQLNPGKVL
ncbi:FAD-binding oxidoreductase [Phenylobacterium sp.]|uniref:FAD-binding oxidoreductase n=1 Tax=Phenylobacterium sp. TaxID=1871053 RepID=UPI002730BBCB|nr:FAD-binding oxidoreductase [Phenylobacterium sp.]MDP2214331.1 FAD-binding oxidoreductase [Phenylobacterium sp.]